MTETLNVTIRKNDTGETRAYQSEHDCTGEHADYIWSEGNYACDCNRSLFFQRAGGVVAPESGQCGSDAYSICVKTQDGRVIWDELDEVRNEQV